MKKLLLISIVLCFSLYSVAQLSYQFKSKVGEDKHTRVIADQPSETSGNTNYNYLMPNYKAGTSAKAIEIRDIGQAGNAWGLSSGGRTFMWADDDINSVVFLHRMLNPPGTGFLAYDLSVDNGNTWEVDQQVWDPAAGDNARYPQVVIYNPPGNIDPAAAVMTYFAPTLDASNGASWGGYGWGTNMLTAVNPTNPTMLGHTSPGGGILQSVPDAYHITNGGKAFCYEPVLVDGLFDEYTGQLVITSGYYDDGLLLMDYQQDLMDFTILDGARISNSKVAFGPDGQTGYMCILSNNGSADLAEGTYYPIIFKTTDAGVNWDGPYHVQLGGPGGLPAVLNYLTDELLELLFTPPVPPRDELLFTTAFDCDIAVDAMGDPHIMFVVGLGSGEYSIYTSIEGFPGTGGMIAMIHAASYGGDLTTWYADTISLPQTFRGVFPGSTGSDLSEDTRPYISTTPDGTKMFFSYQNTYWDVSDDNISPDIFCRGYDVGAKAYSDLFDVTQWTGLMWQSWMATASYYVFDHGGEYEIPFVCQVMNPANNIDPVQFKYVDEFRITDADFIHVSTNELPDIDNLTISNIYPNPVQDNASVNITLKQGSELKVDVRNILGQTVQTIDFGYYNSGNHTISIDANEYGSGIYFFTFTTGDETLTKKLIIE